MNNKGADQTVQMRRLICAFVVRIWQKGFLMMGPISSVGMIGPISSVGIMGPISSVGIMGTISSVSRCHPFPLRAVRLLL